MHGLKYILSEHVRCNEIFDNCAENRAKKCKKVKFKLLFINFLKSQILLGFFKIEFTLDHS